MHQVANNSPRFRLSGAHILSVLISVALFRPDCALSAELQFNTDMLDIKERENINIQQFSQKGYILPGTYPMVVYLNQSELPEQDITFLAPENDPAGSEACITPALVEQWGLRPDAQKKLSWWHNGQCLTLSSLEGAEARGDLGNSALRINLPQAYLEYSSPDWDPPARWDEGVPGVLFDYNLYAQASRQQASGSKYYNLSGNGTSGANVGPWRVRADWQASHVQNSTGMSDTRWDWSRFYAYRALPHLRAQLSLGENYLYSDVFDSFRFTGVSLNSNDNMLPPNLRGYAPEVTGIAKTNAKVVISQQGRVIYETHVATGPFRIQDINDAVNGTLDVRVEEQDGTVQKFTVNTASVPYLTRPGRVRYKLATGRPSDFRHHINGPTFAAGEYSWGINNGWSLYGGGIASARYGAVSVGLGRDLLFLGALSFDATQSQAKLPHTGTQSGRSYRLSYSKRFEEYDSQVTFAGYRFSQRDFMTMGDYLNAQRDARRNGRNKEMYTVTLNKSFRDLGVTAYLSYTHQSYWNRPASDNFSLSMSRYFDIGRLKNVSVSLAAYRNKFNKVTDDGAYISLSFPFGNSSNISYSADVKRDDTSHDVSYYDRVNENSSYQLRAGHSRRGNSMGGYVSHHGDIADTTASINYQEGQYSSLSVSAQGGAVLTPEGGALHRNMMLGGTRLLVDTSGVPDVPVRGFGAPVYTNRFGKAVISDVNSYYRSSARIDFGKLDDNAEATRSVVQTTLTEGAIGYRRFNVIAGAKAMAIIRLADGSVPPFGASVMNSKKQETGIIYDQGNIYLSGVHPAERMDVSWNGQVQCSVTLPATLPDDLYSGLLLPCLREDEKI